MGRAHGTPPAGVVVRAAQPNDAESHVALWTAVVAEGRWMSMDRFDHTTAEYRRLFQDSVTSDVARLAAVVGEEIVGSIRIARIDSGARRHVASFTMAVALPWRGRGVGIALVEAALHWARQHEVEKVTLDVYASNDAAIGLYRKFGFTEEGRLSRHSRKPHGDEDEIVLAHWIAAAPS